MCCQAQYGCLPEQSILCLPTGSNKRVLIVVEILGLAEELLGASIYIRIFKKLSDREPFPFAVLDIRQFLTPDLRKAYFVGEHDELRANTWLFFEIGPIVVIEDTPEA